MLNQKYFNGIGNYLRAEILDRAGIAPFVSAKNALKKSIERFQRERKPAKTSNDLLTLCKDIPLEVVELNRAKKNKSFHRVKSYKFDDWLECYGKAKKIKDKNGRMVWYRGELGPLIPKKKSKKSENIKKKSEKNIKLKKVEKKKKEKRKRNDSDFSESEISSDSDSDFELPTIKKRKMTTKKKKK
eukprot:TRINITY_DN1054_c0_g1_i3.p1 TRINITY_DN1054_c0_g1~~TRINITY_DN1054_c0_g1_i3.p1  ORF type:complete len:186 (+),score=42.23 TRINITY_DN1054_c0_g1_i3:533-1090(+)